MFEVKGLLMEVSGTEVHVICVSSRIASRRHLRMFLLFVSLLDLSMSHGKPMKVWPYTEVTE